MNRAYQTLRDPDRRARYLLEGAGLADAEKKATIPLELAESWFEIQDSLGEREGRARLESFRRELEAQRTETDAEWARIAAAWASD